MSFPQTRERFAFRSCGMEKGRQTGSSKHFHFPSPNRIHCSTPALFRHAPKTELNRNEHHFPAASFTSFMCVCEESEQTNLPCMASLKSPCRVGLVEGARDLAYPAPQGSTANGDLRGGEG